MRPLLVPLFILCLKLCGIVYASNEHVSFHNCSQLVQWEVMVFGGAVVSSDGSFGLTTHNCSLTLKTTPTSTFLIQLTEFNLPSKEFCLEHLTLQDIRSGQKFLDAACNIPTALPAIWTTNSSELRATLVRNHTTSSTHQPSSFRLIITSIKSSCASGTNFRCSRSRYCITPALRCDNVPHCPEAEDEKGCRTAPQFPPFGVLSTSKSPVVTTPVVEKESLYLWLPLIVVVAFTVIMLTLIMLGRRATHCATTNEGYIATNDLALMATASTTTARDTTLSLLTANTSPGPSTLPGLGNDIDVITIILVAAVFIIVLVACLILGFREKKHRSNELQINEDLRVDINSNPGFTDGAPATPPPTYSMIERQTSYVSNISQTSSQLSIPPDYNDVVDVEDPAVPGRRRRINSARSNTSFTRRNRPKQFQRSMSAQEPYNTGRNRFFPSDRSDSFNSSRGRTSALSDSDHDIVFLESPPGLARPSSNLQPSLGNLSEVDETLGNSTTLTEVTLAHNSAEGDSPGSQQETNGLTNTADSNLAQQRHVLQRSVSDTEDITAVRFSLGE